MKLLVFDNYDSFTYNIVQLLREAGADDITVVRNDRIALEAVERFDKIVLSPGPGIPSEAGILLPLIREYAPSKSILGVCLGHQAICKALGGVVTYAKELMHGKTSEIYTEADSTLFCGLESPVRVARYHSLAASEEELPGTLRITARTMDGEIMAVEHREFPVYGVQFHPESIMTPQGKLMIQNFLNSY